MATPALSIDDRKYQSIERPAVGSAQSLRLVHIKDRGACTGVEALDRNNMLALSPAMYSLIDGGGFRNGVHVGRPPKVRIRRVLISPTPKPFPSRVKQRVYHRYRVRIAVECSDIDIFDAVKRLCRPNATRETLRLILPVHVVNPWAFEGYLNWRLTHSPRA